MATELVPGDEPVTLIQIDQPLCDLTYGSAPCTASLGTISDFKCYNSRFTCQDSPNYDPGNLTLTFSFNQDNVRQYGMVIPSLHRMTIDPMTINIGGLDDGQSPFGVREEVTLTFSDHPYSDLLVDKYRLERPDAHGDINVTGFDPSTAGTFWGKWLARNPYYEGYALRVYEGKKGEPLGNLRVRNYIITEVSGPSGNGKVTVHAQDIFAKVQQRKSKAPVKSQGELASDITSSATSLTLAPSGIGNSEYPASGFVRIGDEIIEFGARAGDVLSTLTRGMKNTTADAHETEDVVQVCKDIPPDSPADILEDLLVNYSFIPSARIPKTEWDSEVTNNIPDLYSAFLSEPVPVEDLVAELSLQAGFTTWPDVEDNEIRFKVLTANLVPVVTVDERAWIVRGSLKPKSQPEKRLSQVWVHYGLKSPVLSVNDTQSYHSVRVVADLDAEDPTQYGTPQAREIFARWIPQFAGSSANRSGDRILYAFRDAPIEASFKLNPLRAGQLKLAVPYTLDTLLAQDPLGANKPQIHFPIEINSRDRGIEIVSQQIKLVQDVGTDRIISIDQDTNNFDARAVHDILFSAPTGVETVKIIVRAGAIVGADNGGPFAFRTGLWPAGVSLHLEIDGTAYICGAGGNGSDAEQIHGEDGGLALLCEYAMTVINDGIIGGGGGGGGGNPPIGGGGGGAGANNLIGFAQVRGGEGGTGLVIPELSQDGNGTDGALETGGLGGDLGGAAGGDLAQAGANSSTNGGAPGDAVNGDSLITWDTLGDVRGVRTG